jgi:hypothetical protein
MKKKMQFSERWEALGWISRDKAAQMMQMSDAPNVTTKLHKNGVPTMTIPGDSGNSNRVLFWSEEVQRVASYRKKQSQSNQPSDDIGSRIDRIEKIVASLASIIAPNE